MSSLFDEAADMIENLRNGDDAYYPPAKIDAMVKGLREEAALTREAPTEGVLDRPARVAGRDFAAGESTQQVIGRAQAHYEVHHKGCFLRELKVERDVFSTPKPLTCEAECLEHSGEVKRVTVSRDGQDYGEYTYCESAVADDQKNGLTVTEHTAPQRMAQGEDCPHESWDVIGGGRRCVDCRKWLGADTEAEATQPPHQDRGEEASHERARLLVPVLKKSAEYWGSHHCASELKRAIEVIEDMLLTAALTEAKQQGPGEVVAWIPRASLERLSAGWSTTCYGPAWAEQGKEVVRDAVPLYLGTPQVEAKRQTGGDA